MWNYVGGGNNEDGVVVVVDENDVESDNKGV